MLQDVRDTSGILTALGNKVNNLVITVAVEEDYTPECNVIAFEFYLKGIM